MTDRTTKLEAALHANLALIEEAQRKLNEYLVPGTPSPTELINELLLLFHGPERREAKRLAADAMTAGGKRWQYR